MSRYLWSILAQAAGAPAEVRPRPVSRFEDLGGGIREELLPPSPMPPVERSEARMERRIVKEATPVVSPEIPGQAVNAKEQPDVLRIATPPRHEREVVREKTEARHVAERVVERTEHLMERRIEVRTERVEAASAAAPIPSAPVPVGREAPPRTAPGPVINTLAFPELSLKNEMATPARADVQSPKFPPTPQPAPQAKRPVQEAPAQPDVTIAIGRLDIRLVREPEAPRRPPAPGVHAEDAGVSLSDYLRDRSRGRS